jgi:hypothetical protein
MGNFELFDVYKQVGEGGDWVWLIQGTGDECDEYVEEDKEENEPGVWVDYDYVSLL